MRVLQEIRADGLRIGDRFVIEPPDSTGSALGTIFVTWAIGYGGQIADTHMEIACLLANEGIVSFILKPDHVLYLVEPQPIATRAGDIQVGDHFSPYVDNCEPKYVAYAILKSRTIPNARDIFVSEDDHLFHTSDDRVVWKRGYVNEDGVIINPDGSIRD